MDKRLETFLIIIKSHKLTWDKLKKDLKSKEELAGAKRCMEQLTHTFKVLLDDMKEHVVKDCKSIDELNIAFKSFYNIKIEIEELRDYIKYQIK